MKAYILLIAFAVAIAEVQSTILEELIQTDQKCRDESQISEEDIRELLSLKATQPAKCYLKCFLASEGYWQDGQINKQAVLDILNRFKPLQKFEGPVSEILDQCSDVKGADECDSAFEATKCVLITGVKTVGQLIAELLFSD